MWKRIEKEINWQIDKFAARLARGFSMTAKQCVGWTQRSRRAGRRKRPMRRIRCCVWCEVLLAR